ncbi:MAG: serine/threonine protein phosphatase, partial [Olegusella sp.]|nr:serine/threonine protein phosphatase [Olegusella sp.]
TYARVGDRLYFMSHAGLNRKGPWDATVLDEAADDADRIEQLTKDQHMDDLVWVRHEFWGRPTKLVGEDGKGIIAIAGHTPTPYLDEIADHPDRPGVGEGGLGQMVRVGAGDETGGVADRWDIDCGCAGGYGFGRLLLLRLDDGEEFYEPVREGE